MDSLVSNRAFSQQNLQFTKNLNSWFHATLKTTKSVSYSSLIFILFLNSKKPQANLCGLNDNTIKSEHIKSWCGYKTDIFNTSNKI